MNLVAAVISLCLISNPNQCFSRSGQVEAKACSIPSVLGKFDITGGGAEMVRVKISCNK